MQLSRNVADGVLEIAADGRLDGYWSDHLERVLTDAISDGHHQIRLDCSRLTFLSSAGIGILVKFRQRLAAINGTFHVVNPSKAVSLTLTITRLAEILVPTSEAKTPTVWRQRVVRHVERDGAGFDVYELDARASLTCQAVGSPAALLTGTFAEEDSVSLPQTPVFALGVGAFGGTTADCRSRFGELLSVANATAYQPADGTNVPDYLLAKGDGVSDVRLLYGLTCSGRFSHLIRFQALPPRPTIGLARLAASCLDAAAAKAIGIVVIAEAAGLVGAALRRSPADRFEGADFFAHPEVRGRLAFTSEPAFVRGVALAAGVVTSDMGHAEGPLQSQLRPLGPECRGHLHAAAFRFRPIKKGPLELEETASGLFDNESLLGVLHLLHDDRGIGGAGESEFFRGACWIAPIAADAL